MQKTHKTFWYKNQGHPTPGTLSNQLSVTPEISAPVIPKLSAKMSSRGSSQHSGKGLAHECTSHDHCRCSICSARTQNSPKNRLLKRSEASCRAERPPRVTLQHRHPTRGIRGVYNAPPHKPPPRELEPPRFTMRHLTNRRELEPARTSTLRYAEEKT